MRPTTLSFVFVITLLSISITHSNLHAHELTKTRAAYGIGLDAGAQNRDGLVFRKRWETSYIQLGIFASGELGDTNNHDDFILASDTRMGYSFYRGNFDAISMPFGVSVFGRAGVNFRGVFDDAMRQPLNSRRRIDLGPGISFDLFNPGTTGFELSFALSLLLTMSPKSDVSLNHIDISPSTSTSFIYNWQ